LAAEFVQRSRQLVEQGQYEEAVRVCRLGLLANPGEIEGRLVLGSALIALTRFSEVLAEMRIALDMDPSNPSAMALKGEALLKRGDAEQALAVLTQAERGAPGDPYVERLREEAEVALRAGGRLDLTMDIDPEIEGVELRGFEDSVEESGEIELSADDLLVAEDSQFGSPSKTRDLRARRDLRLPSPFDESLDDDFDPGDVELNRDLPPSVDSLDFGGSRDYRTASGQVSSAPAPQRRDDTIGALFPEDEPGVSSLEVIDPVSGEPVSMQKRSGGGERALPDLRGQRSEDMSLIRRGLGMSGDPRKAALPRSVSMAEKAPAEPRKESTLERRRRRIPLGVWLAFGLVVVASGLFVGLKVRELRLNRQIASTRERAVKLAGQDTYLGYRQARDLEGRIVKVRNNQDTRAALARAQAALAAEFGDGIGEARAMVAELGQVSTEDALLARAYLGLAAGNAAEVSSVAATLMQDHGDSDLGHYLLGRAHLLEGDAAKAVESLSASLELSPRPLAYIALARAEAQRGNYSEALAAVGRVEELVPGHPTARIWQARFLALSGQLPENPEDPDKALETLISLRDESNPLALSPAQRAWAGLVLGQIKLLRGDRKAAKTAVAQAKVARPNDWMFSEMLARVLVDLGELKAARAEAEKSLESWPARGEIRIVIAKAALRGGDAGAALKALEETPNADSNPDALTVRGAARLALGQADLAAGDLDQALQLRPGFRDAVIERARVDIARGSAAAAVKRLEDLYRPGAAAELAVPYAAALREANRVADARKVLDPLVGDGASALSLVELAHLEWAQGRLEESRKAFERAAAEWPGYGAARLGLARLEIASGNPAAARKILEGLLESDGKNPSVLVYAAQARILTGDAEGAKALLDSASAAGWLGWMVARERGRALLRRQQPIEALSELQRAQSLKPSDEETRVLLMYAHHLARNKRGSLRALEDITKTFRDSPIRALASGMHALLDERTTDAIAQFSEARSQLLDRKAAPRELARVAYWLGRCYEFEGNLTMATEWLVKATKLDGGHADAYYWLGQIDFRNNKQRSMLINYKKSVDIDPGQNPLAWFFLGQQYAKVGKKDLANTALQNFLKYWPEDSGDVVIEAKTLLGQLR
jgi:tetratricopeptide (TPR) repeat protein